MKSNGNAKGKILLIVTILTFLLYGCANGVAERTDDKAFFTGFEWNTKEKIGSYEWKIKQKEVAKYPPEKVIREYIKALDKKDTFYAGVFLSDRVLRESFDLKSQKCDVGSFPFIEGYRSEDGYITTENLISAKARDIKFKEKVSKKKLIYSAYITVKHKVIIALDNYEMPWDFYMVYEGDALGWKIERIGHC